MAVWGTGVRLAMAISNCFDFYGNNLNLWGDRRIA